MRLFVLLVVETLRNNLLDCSAQTVYKATSPIGGFATLALTPPFYIARQHNDTDLNDNQQPQKLLLLAHFTLNNCGSVAAGGAVTILHN